MNVLMCVYPDPLYCTFEVLLYTLFTPKKHRSSHSKNVLYIHINVFIILMYSHVNSPAFSIFMYCAIACLSVLYRCHYIFLVHIKNAGYRNVYIQFHQMFMKSKHYNMVHVWSKKNSSTKNKSIIWGTEVIIWHMRTVK